jgi:hypothetical protein
MKKTKRFENNVVISVRHDILLSDVVDSIQDFPGADHENIARLIVSMDLAMADWEFTEKLIAHFKALELEFEKEEPGSTPIEPKKINP